MDVGGLEMLVLAVAGGVMPPVVSWLKGQGWSTTVKTVFSMGVSLVVTAVVLLVTGNVDLASTEFWASASVTWSVSQVVYQTYFKSTNVNDKLTSIGSGG